jgi:hypothetical protein
MTLSETARLRTLEEENRRLKKTLAEAVVDNSVLKDLLKKPRSPAARFATVKRVTEDHGFPEHRACRLIGVDRTASLYQRSRTGDATVREQSKANPK